MLIFLTKGSLLGHLSNVFEVEGEMFASRCFVWLTAYGYVYRGHSGGFCLDDLPSSVVSECLGFALGGPVRKN